MTTTARAAGRLAATRDSWHRVAEHVLAAAQYADTGRIGLRPSGDGIATAHPMPGDRRLAIAGTELVLVDESGTRRAPLTTIAAAAQFAGIVPGMPPSVYPPATPLDVDAPLHIDPESARLLADWYALGDSALRRFAAEVGSAAQPTLWPEHFDVGITVGEINFGASPGDDLIPQPYAYVGPHAGPPAPDTYWNAPFGAARTSDAITSPDLAVAFYREGYGLITAHCADGDSSS